MHYEAKPTVPASNGINRPSQAHEGEQQRAEFYRDTSEAIGKKEANPRDSHQNTRQP
jgi:hypothetical protein